MMPTRRESRLKNSPLEQARLADLNFNFQTVNSRKGSTPARTEKHKQVGLEAFGFIKSSTVKPEPLQRKRRKVVVRSPRISLSASASSRTFSLSPPPSSIDTQDREIAETQFAQPDLQFEDGLDPATEEREGEINPPVVSFPSLIPVALKPGPLQMLPPPTTPKRRKALEVPSSHSPPATPISPYKSPSIFLPLQKSLLSHHKSPLQSPRKSPSKWSKSGLVASSQWWDNEETGLSQGFTQGPAQGRISLEISEEDEDEDDFFNQTFYAGRLFQTDRARGSFSPVEETQAATYSTSLKIKAEEDLDTPDLPWFHEWEDSHQHKRIETMIPEARQKANARNVLKIKKESQEEEGGISPRSTQTQDRWKSQHHDQEDTVIPESLLSPSHGSRKEVHWEDSDRTRGTSTSSTSSTSSTPPGSLLGTSGARSTPEETQYGDGTQVQYEWWGILSATTEGGGEGKRASTREETEDQEVQIKNSGITKKGERGLGHEENILGSDDAMPTMSQLLPETLMESFPVPPPLTQWSSQPTGGADDDDEL